MEFIEDIDEEKSILRLPGIADVLPVMFRHLARQGQCVRDLRLVCQDFNRIILGMSPAISCRDNFLRNLEKEKEKSVAMSVQEAEDDEDDNVVLLPLFTEAHGS